MSKFIGRRPSPALVIALIALFVAMGGTGYAALRVTGASVKNGSLTGADIRTNSVTGTDVKDIKAADVRNYSLTGKDIARDSLGQVPIKEERLDASKFGKVRLAGNAEQLGGVDAKAFQPITRSGILKIAKGAPAGAFMKFGPFTLLGKCQADGANTRARVVIATTQTGSRANRGENSDTIVDEGFTPTTPEDDRDLFDDTGGPKHTWGGLSFSALGADGARYEGSFTAATGWAGSDCAFFGHVL